MCKDLHAFVEALKHEEHTEGLNSTIFTEEAFGLVPVNSQLYL